MKKNIITFSKSGASSSKIRNIKWNAESNLDNFTKSGQYYITGYRASGTDSLPISNVGEWHNISALLTVTDSGEADTQQRNRIVGQTLILSNRVGGETKIFTRSCNMVSGGGLWTAWSTAQGLREVGGVSPVDIASYTDSGLYSGAITDSELSTMPMMPGTTFLLVVINNSQLASLSGSSQVRACTQLMYVLPYSHNASLDGISEGSIYLRTGMRNATTGIYEWGDWNSYDNRLQLIEKQLAELNLSGDVKGVISDDGSIITSINPQAPIMQEITMVLNILLEAHDGSDNIKSTMRQYVGTAVSEMVDEEDITIDEDNLLRLKNRSYSKGVGMGYVILRRGKSFASQVTAANTIYEIRYDFDLAGEEVAIPEGCTLKFEGGIISNGQLVIGRNVGFEGEIILKDILRIIGTIKNNYINSDNYSFVNDINKIEFIFNQIKNNTEIVFNGEYVVDCSQIDFINYKLYYSNGQSSAFNAWKRFGKIENLILIGNNHIQFLNCPTDSYKNILYFENGINNSTISLSATGSAEYYTTGTDYGLNFIQIIGDSIKNNISLRVNKFAVPFAFGDYFGNDGLGLRDSNIKIVGDGNKYGSRIEFAENCDIYIKNSYGHRGLYVGGISYSNIKVDSKYMDTNVAILIRSSHVNGKISGSHDLHIEVYDLGTDASNNNTPGIVCIGSYGGYIDGGIHNRTYPVTFYNIDIIATYSKDSNVKNKGGHTPFLITNNDNDTNGREIVPKDIKRNIRVTSILPDGKMTEDITIFNIYNTYDGRFDEIDLFYEVVNSSDNKNILYTGSFAVNNNHTMIVKTDYRLTPLMYRVTLPVEDWLITKDEYNGSFLITFQSPSLYLPAFNDNQIYTINNRNEAIADYIILDNVKTIIDGGLQIPLYKKNMQLYNNIGNKQNRPVKARNGDTYFDTTLDKSLYWRNGKWFDFFNNNADINYSGTMRPTGINVGFQFFDSNLKKPIWWNGSEWCDAYGNVVE